jgi:ascorbate-specific PTS system EIIC-type component UlaA
LHEQIANGEFTVRSVYHLKMAAKENVYTIGGKEEFRKEYGKWIYIPWKYLCGGLAIIFAYLLVFMILYLLIVVFKFIFINQRFVRKKKKKKRSKEINIYKELFDNENISFKA